MPDKAPEPDKYGRLRVRDNDARAHVTIHAAELPHGNYTVLKQDASDRAGDPLPPEFMDATDSPSNKSTSGQTAESK
jgi:hypothetical protein